MSWAIAADWLAVAGLTLLTFGTGAQAWANLAEFKSLRKAVSGYAGDVSTVAEFGTDVFLPGMSPIPAAGNGLLGRLIAAIYVVVLFPGFFRDLRDQGGEEAVQLARFLRQAVVWGILMIGSALALVAAAIQLALA